MPLKNVIKQKWEILYYEHNEHRCDVQEYLESLTDEDYACIAAKIQILAEKGRVGIPTKIFHEAGEDVILHKKRPNETKCKMYGLHHKQIRLYAILIEEEQLIIFTHGTRKKDQKTNPQDKKQFKRIVKRLEEEGEL